MRQLMLPPICFFLFASICAIPVSGQEIVGTVHNAEGKAIEFASLVLWASSGEKILTYSTTDQSGRYRLEGQQWEGLLVVSSLGYLSDTVEVRTPPQGNSLSIDFHLQVATFELQSVEISDSRIPYKTQGDTTTYQSDFFTDGTEQTVEELVKKLPGVAVSDDGTISYKGKQVDKVLLENDELFGKKYTVGTRSLRADVVDEIQFIDHYVDNPLLKEVEQSDQLAMNISIKEDRKKLLFGDVDLGGGDPGRYEGKLNAFSLYKKHKGILIGNAENTASSQLDMYSLFGEGISFDNPYEYSRSSRYFTGLPSYFPFELKTAEVKDGRIFQGATNIILNPNDRVKIRSYGLGFNDRWGLQSNVFYRDLNLGIPFEYAARSAYAEDNHGLELNVEGIWQISTRSNMKYTFNTSGSQMAGMANTLVQLPGKDSILQIMGNQNQVHIHRLNWVGKLNDRQVVVVDAAYYADIRTQDFFFDYTSDNFSGVAKIHQRSTHQVKDADLLASLLGKRGPLKYALSFKYRTQTDRLRAILSTNDLLQQEVDFDDQMLNDYQQHFLALIGSFSTQLGIARWFSKIEIGYRRSTLIPEMDHPIVHNSLYPNITTGLSIKINKKSDVSISGTVDSRAPELEQVFAGKIFTSFRSIVSGVARIDPYLAYSGIITFKHSNNAKLMEFSTSGIYSNNARAYVDRYFYQDVFSIREKQVIDGGHHWSVNANLDKFLPFLSANLGLKLYGTANKSYLLASDATVNEVQVNTQTVEISYTTVFDGPINLGLTGSSDWAIYSRIQANAPIRSRNQRFGLNYFVTCKPMANFFLKLNTRQVFTNNQGQQSKVLYLGGLRAEYNFSSLWRCGLMVHNLWNTRRFNLEQLGSESYAFNQWQLNRRMILLTAGFKF